MVQTVVNKLLSTARVSYTKQSKVAHHQSYVVVARVFPSGYPQVSSYLCELILGISTTTRTRNLSYATHKKCRYILVTQKFQMVINARYYYSFFLQCVQFIYKKYSNQQNVSVMEFYYSPSMDHN